MLSGGGRMVRTYDVSLPVPAEVVDRIVGNGLRAPSAGFSEGWGFLVLDNLAMWPGSGGGPPGGPS